MRLHMLGSRFEVLDPLFRVFVHHRVFDSHARDRRVPAGRKQRSPLI
jgi:hypothetical protein